MLIYFLLYSKVLRHEGIDREDIALHQDVSGISLNDTYQNTTLNFSRTMVIENNKSDIDSIAGDFEDFI